MEYDIIEIKGKHGMINLHIPRKEPTEEEITEVCKAIAEISINNSRNKKPTE